MAAIRVTSTIWVYEHSVVLWIRSLGFTPILLRSKKKRFKNKYQVRGRACGAPGDKQHVYA